MAVDAGAQTMRHGLFLLCAALTAGAGCADTREPAQRGGTPTLAEPSQESFCIPSETHIVAVPAATASQPAEPARNFLAEPDGAPKTSCTKGDTASVATPSGPSRKYDGRRLTWSKEIVLYDASADATGLCLPVRVVATGYGALFSVQRDGTSITYQSIRIPDGRAAKCDGGESIPVAEDKLFLVRAEDIETDIHR